jgi:hypothetical protein
MMGSFKFHRTTKQALLDLDLLDQVNKRIV